MALNNFPKNQGIRRRLTASFSFGIAALLCQSLTWLFTTIDREYWGRAALSLEISAIPVAMIVAFIWWPKEVKGPKASTWDGFSVLLVYLNVMAIIGTSLYGPYESVREIIQTFAHLVAFTIKVLGPPLLLTFCMTGFLLCDENIE